jgi:DNA polymerase (family 10)
MDKKDIIKALELYADLLEFHGENPFKVRAFRNASFTIRRLEGDVKEMIKDGSIKSVKGIGKGILAFLESLVYDEESAELTDIIAKTPEGILELLSLKGLGAKKIAFLHESLGIENLFDLEKACKEGKLSTLKGFGKKTEAKILSQLEKLKESKRFLYLHSADTLMKNLLELLHNIPSVQNLTPVGEYRRVREVISKIEVLVLARSIKEFADEIRGTLDIIAEDNSDGFKTFSCEFGGFEKNEIIVAEKQTVYDALLLEKTGSEDFLNELGLKNKTGEEEFFTEKGLPFVIPEMREKEYFLLPENLRKNSDLTVEGMKGLLHFHTTFSDGLNSLEEMLQAAEKSGFEYAAVCDHSQNAFYANGLEPERVFKQRELIEKLQKDFAIKILHGIEVDILSDGSLDYDEKIMKEFDFVVASIHSNFGMSEEAMTDRIIRAVENPFTDVLAHPTGRLLLQRDGYKVNIKKIIDACARNSVAIEINANPYRLDLDWRNIFYAREKGCLFSINPDAHSVSHIDYIKYGIKIARKGGVQKREVINFFTYKEFINFLNRKLKRFEE